MADFHIAVKPTIKSEGGYANDPDDTGGETYKGVSRKYNPKWPGWAIIDGLKGEEYFEASLNNSVPLHKEVLALYRVKYWGRIRGDDIYDQDIADSIFDFSVNAGPKKSAKLAQGTVGAFKDGIIGPITLKKINAYDKRGFLAEFAMAKVEFYVRSRLKTEANRKFFFGWIRRTSDKHAAISSIMGKK